MTRSIIAEITLSISFWGDALLTAACILNTVPSKSVSSTPYELQLCRSTRKSVQYYEIEAYVFLISPIKFDEPTSIIDY